MISLTSNSDFLVLDMDGAVFNVDLTSLAALEHVIEDEDNGELTPSWSGMLKSMIVHLLNTF